MSRPLLILVALVALAAPACAFDEPTVVIGELVDAARRGDRDDFLACFTPRSRPILEVWWRAADTNQPELGVLGAGDVRVVGMRPFSDRDYGPERVLLSLREGTRSMPLVLHKLGGSWRVDLHDTERVSQGGIDP